jgi:hypothetical protein
MSVRNSIVLLLALSTLSLLVGCGSSGSGITTGVAPPSGAFSPSNLNGTYVFSVSGTDLDNGTPYAVAGTIIANGSGGITGGTIDMNDIAFGTAGAIIAAPVNNNGHYGVGDDGRGTATINFPGNPFGSNLTFDFVLQNSFHGLVTEFDGIATGSGTLDAQTAGVTPAGAYAFSLSGATFSGNAFATVGNFALTGSSVTAGLEDFNLGGAPETNDGTGYPVSGTVVAGGSSSSLSSLTTSTGFGTDGALQFDVYPIDSTHLKFIEVDTYATLSGDAFTEATSVPSGNLVFTLSGIQPGDTPFAAGGLMVTSGGSIVSGSTEDYNSGGTSVSTPGSPIPFLGSYSGASGRFALVLSSFIGGTDYVAYPSSGGMLLLETDSSTLSIESGAAYAQVSGASFAASQGYGLNLTGANITSEVPEVDDIAEFAATASGTSCTENTGNGNVVVNSAVVVGVDDENSEEGTIPGQALCGTYGSIDTSGRLNLTYYTDVTNGGAELTAYTVDGNIFPFIEADSGQVSSGVFELQNANATSPAMARPRSMFVPHPIIRPNAAKQKKQTQK